MDSNIEQLLKNLSISDSKISEISKKGQITNNIARISSVSPSFSRLHYSLACTAPKSINVQEASKLINSGLIRHENMLRALYNYHEKGLTEPIQEYIQRNDPSRDEIVDIIKKKSGMDKKRMLREIKSEIPFADFKIVMEEIKSLPEVASPIKAVARSNSNTDTKYSWLDEGEVSQLSKPEANKQANTKILEEHLNRTGGRVVTRFPPEPNGNLHIGHVKALNLNFNYAEKYSGVTYLRFDDTNPRNEKEEHYKSILEDIEWLGFKPSKITSSSEYNDFMNEKSVELIKKGKAYVCHCNIEDIRLRRQIFQRERDNGRFDPTILSPYRNRTMDENLKEFSRMMNGCYSDGAAVLRFKMDLESKNPLMLDLVGSRIINIEHPGKKRNWRVYPSYEFALCVADSLEDVTHSFCSREFLTRQESYHWLLRNLEMYEPVQWEFSRLNLSNTVLSKRKMNKLVEMGMGWDDPRLYTVKGMRRRGFTANAINSFVKSVGLTFSESIVDVKILENFVRADLDLVASRVFCIKQPLKVTINNMNRKTVEIPALGRAEGNKALKVDVRKVVYIEADDFCENLLEESHLLYQRLTREQPVGLIGIGTIKFVERSNDGIICELCDAKPKKHIHWVVNLENKVTLRLYKPLFKSFNPDQVGYLDDLLLDSCEISKAYCDERIKEARPYNKYQFVRMGYFCCDVDSKEGDLIFNLTIPLKSSY